MGTFVHLCAGGADRSVLERALDAAQSALERVDALMSFHRADGELTRINRLAAQAPQPVDAWTHAVLRGALRFARASDGLFNVCIAPAMIELGLLPAVGSASIATGDWRDIRMLSDRRVFFSSPLLIDLGGIAKGFAVDVAIHALRRHGCAMGAVNAGGDLRRFGSTAETMFLRRDDHLMPVAELRCGAIATSSGHRDADAGVPAPIGHLIDPRTGRPWRGGSVMVAAGSCMIADALTKVAALAGPACRPLLARFGAQAFWDH